MGLKLQQDQTKRDSVSPVVWRLGVGWKGDEPRDHQVRMMIVDVLRSNAGRLRGRKVILFGSRARGTAKPPLDFDVGIIGKIPLPLKDFYVLEDMLDDLPTLYCIGLVDFARVTERFRRRAL